MHAICRNESALWVSGRGVSSLSSGIDPRIDFGCRVSSDHMVEDKLAAWMSLLPAIVESKNIVLEDDDGLASGDEVLDLTPCVYP